MILIGKQDKGPMIDKLEALLEEVLFPGIPVQNIPVIRSVLTHIAQASSGEVNVTCRLEVIPVYKRLQVTLQIDDHNPVVGGVS